MPAIRWPNALLIAVLALSLGLTFGTSHPGMNATASAAAPGENKRPPEPKPEAARASRSGPGWITSRITGSLDPPPKYRTEHLFAKLEFARPVVITSVPGTQRVLVMENKGRVVTFPNRQDVEEPDELIQLAKQKDGFWRAYGLAFHPRFEQNRQVFICYTIEAGIPSGTRVSRFKIAELDPPRIDPNSEEVIIEWPSGGHNGGCLQFGPDGLLYITSGDGRSPSPPDALNTGQDIGDLLASVLRIDVDRAEADRPYTVPADNPFLATPGARPEVWAYGLRNPWKMAFDPRSGDLLLGDVGWELWEMIYRIERGGNYGWSVQEGRQSVRPEAPRGPTPILPPLVDHSHTESRSVTGGRFYGGAMLKELAGAYIYGDYVTGKLWGLRHAGNRVTWHEELADSPLAIVAFGEDPSGELLILDYAGTIHRLVENPAAAANRNFPKRLSETGLFASVKNHRLAAGVVPYSINSEAWADHATAQRYLAIPGTEQLGVHTKTNVQVGTIAGNWKFPIDSVLVKTLSLETEAGNPNSRRRIETQILHRYGDAWNAYTFAWNDQQSDAEMVAATGADRSYTILDPSAPGGQRQQTWHFASRAECIICHTTRAGSIHAFNVAQLNRAPEDDPAGDQLARLDALGLFAEPLPDELAKETQPFDPSLDLSERARSYLHVNCAHCHRRGGGGNAAFELRRELTLEKTLAVGLRPSQGTFGIHGAAVIAPGDPYRSILYYRMAKLGRGRMPHAGSSVVDQRGLSLIHDWIASLPAEETSQPTNLAQQNAAALKAVRVSKESGDALDRPLEQLLSTTSGALQLLRAMDEDAAQFKAKNAVLARATVHPDAAIRDLFERFVPEEQRIRRLGSVVDPGEILKLTGQAERGKQLFFAAEGVQCKKCHRIGKQGGEVGPELTEIGKKHDRAMLLEMILQPSKKIDPKWVTYLLETDDGRLFSGLLVGRTDKQVTLKDAQGKLVTIEKPHVELLAPQQKSLMPELLLKDMTAQQVADLLAYLHSLK